MNLCTLVCWAWCCSIQALMAILTLSLIVSHANHRSHLLHIPKENYSTALFSSALVMGTFPGLTQHHLIYAVFGSLSVSYLIIQATMKKRDKRRKAQDVEVDDDEDGLDPLMSFNETKQ
eukprot:GHVN01004189.1.p1 GENE.GHVN01004189.1~~GHVN01004189.1.p1  ORF type:complete len:119 (+),score=19.55 GHVN01004189.1:375-731(+)